MVKTYPATMSSVPVFSERDLRREVGGRRNTSITTRNHGLGVWEQPVLDELDQLSTLPAGWDSYGARQIRPESLVAAFELLNQIMVEGAPTPSVVPVRRGTVQIEWHVRDIDLEIEVRSETEFVASYNDERTGEEWEETFSTDLTKLARAVRTIARR